MLFSKYQLLLWGLRPKGVLHVGAHIAEEDVLYKKFKFGKIIWVEAQSSLMPLLREKAGVNDDIAIEAVVWDRTGESLTLSVTNNSQSTSVLGFGTHLSHYPDVQVVTQRKVLSVRLDEILPKNAYFNFVNLDIQGAELRALIGLGSRIQQVDFIYSEVNKQEVYLGCSTIDELDAWLHQKGFERVAVSWVKQGWGDALYGRMSIVRKVTYLLPLRKLAFYGLMVWQLAGQMFSRCSSLVFRRSRRD